LIRGHTNWLLVGIIGIVLGVILIFAGGYAENYQELDGPARDSYGMPLIRVPIKPYAPFVLPLVTFGLCALAVGIIGVLYDRTLARTRAQKVGLKN